MLTGFWTFSPIIFFYTNTQILCVATYNVRLIPQLLYDYFFKLFLKGSNDTVHLRDVANMELNNTLKNLA